MSKKAIKIISIEKIIANYGFIKEAEKLNDVSPVYSKDGKDYTIVHDFGELYNIIRLHEV